MEYSQRFFLLIFLIIAMYPIYVMAKKQGRSVILCILITFMTGYFPGLIYLYFSQKKQIEKRHIKFYDELIGIPDLSKKIAEYIVDEYKTAENFSKLTEEEISELPGLSKKLSKALHNRFSK